MTATVMHLARDSRDNEAPYFAAQLTCWSLGEEVTAPELMNTDCLELVADDIGNSGEYFSSCCYYYCSTGDK